MEASLETVGPTRQKSLGAYYTPPELAQAVVEWAVRERADHVLDPAFGGSVFLQAAERRLRELGCEPRSLGGQTHGCDLDEAAHEAALTDAASDLDPARLVLSDFFLQAPGDELPRCQAVVGNPPYVRYQLSDAAAGQRAALKAGLQTSRLSSIWAPFVAHSVQFVAPGGRLAYVLPAELLHAQYAAGVLDFVCARFSSVTVALFGRRVFPGALEEVVLLLADGAGGECPEATVVSFADLGELTDRGLPRATSGSARDASPQSPPTSARTAHDKLLSRLLPAETRELLGGLLSTSGVTPLGVLASVDIGAVTGANRFFLLADAQAQEDGLDDGLLHEAVSKAVHVAGACLTPADIERLRAAGAPMRLLTIPRGLAPDELATAKTTLARGLAAGVDKAYKCRVRTPWWSVPIPRHGPPDLLLTYCAAEHHRLAVNDARVLHTNTVHGVRVHPGTDARALAASWTNSLTMLSCELVGRSYGGGVLKLEPTEAEAVVLPPLVADDELLITADRLVRARDLPGALSAVDEAVLGGGLGLADEDIRLLREGAELLRARRRGRGKA
ncbi:MAG: N-6 DNA methylase [Solirubrobacteraceae bacterium]